MQTLYLFVDQLPQVVIEDGLHSDDLRKDHQVTAPTSGPQDPPNSKNSTKATSTPGDITPPTTGEQENYVVCKCTKITSMVQFILAFDLFRGQADRAVGH